jgi:hypothetical protein
MEMKKRAKAKTKKSLESQLPAVLVLTILGEDFNKKD